MNTKIFIVEDNSDIREIYRLVFELAGFQVEASENGLDAISRLPEVRPDIILLDIMLPEMDGFEVLKAVKQNIADSGLQNTPIVVWSNLSQEEDIQKAMSLGASYYLRKSDYDGDALVEKVKDILEKLGNNHFYHWLCPPPL
jgi:CheY-like chemotaxis protein